MFIEVWLVVRMSEWLMTVVVVMVFDWCATMLVLLLVSVTMVEVVTVVLDGGGDSGNGDGNVLPWWRWCL